MWGLVLSLVAVARAGFECPKGGLYQTPHVDLNCNGWTRDDDPHVDTQDPVCAANLDPATAEPYESGDLYYDYVSYACDVFVTFRPRSAASCFCSAIAAFAPSIES